MPAEGAQEQLLPWIQFRFEQFAYPQRAQQSPSSCNRAGPPRLNTCGLPTLTHNPIRRGAITGPSIENQVQYLCSMFLALADSAKFYARTCRYCHRPDRFNLSQISPRIGFSEYLATCQAHSFRVILCRYYVRPRLRATRGPWALPSSTRTDPANPIPATPRAIPMSIQAPYGQRCRINGIAPSATRPFVRCRRSAPPPREQSTRSFSLV